MHSNTYPASESKESFRPRIRILIAAIALLVIALLFAALSIIRTVSTAAALRESAFELSDASEHSYAAAGNGLAAVCGDTAQLFNSGGKCVASADVDFSSPRCAAGTKIALYYSAGERELVALYPDGKSAHTDADGGVRCVRVNEEGLCAVLTDKESYLGSVVVYDESLTPLFRLDATSITPKAAAVNTNGMLCISGEAENGGYLRFFLIDAENMQSEFYLENEPILDFSFLSDGSVAAITEKALYFVSTDGTLLSKYPFDKESVSAYSFGSNYAAAALAGLKGGSTAVLTISPDGEVIGTFYTPQDVAAVSVNGENLLVLFEGQESTLFTSGMEEVVSYQPRDDVQQIFLCSDERAIFAGASAVMQIDFSR